MPELPEVETTLRGIAPFLRGRTIRAVRVRNPALRWPVTAQVQRACGQRVLGCRRRAKYLLIDLPNGGLMLHLGMSGSLRICAGDEAYRKHDHVDIALDSELGLRLHDPRRFGAVLWWDPPAEDHALLRALGPEPLSPEFSGRRLWRQSRGRRVAVKNFIMDSKNVAGIGNIYASEALFRCGIHPGRQAGRVSLVRYEALADAIRDVLEHAIRRGGTTLRDFLGSDGEPGYFARELLVYERAGKPCFQCRRPIRRKLIGQRSTYYCTHCQR